MSSFQIPQLDLAQKPHRDIGNINNDDSSAKVEEMLDNSVGSTSQWEQDPSILSSPWHIEARSITSQLSDQSSKWLLFPSMDGHHEQEVLSGDTTGNIDDTPYAFSTTSSQLTEDTLSFADNLDDLSFHNAELTQRRNATNQRIEQWRQEQVSILYGELSVARKAAAASGETEKSLSLEARDLLTKWDLESISTDRRWRKCTKIDKLYGDYVIRGYSASQLKAIKYALNDLASFLKQSLKNPPKSSAIVKQSREPKRGTNRHTGSQFMNNPSLQKYIPLYLKNIIVESNLFYEFQKQEGGSMDNSQPRVDEEIDADSKVLNEQPFHEPASLRGSNFWEVESVDSSQFTIRSESILGF